MTTRKQFRVQTLNAISGAGLSRFPDDLYDVGGSLADPDALLVRSARLHDAPVPESVLAIARAGAGTNNIPVAAMTERGVPVFNTPGANANAVKELVLAGLFIASRNLIPAARFAHTLEGDDAAIARAVEAGKKQFIGFELPGRTLGVIGLGAIGVQVANAALGLGLSVVGFDPGISVEHAWHLSAEVERAESIEDVFRRADILTVHVPLIEATRGLVSTQRIALMKDSAVILNFARAEIVDEDAVISALDADALRGYHRPPAHPRQQGLDAACDGRVQDPTAGRGNLRRIGMAHPMEHVLSADDVHDAGLRAQRVQHLHERVDRGLPFNGVGGGFDPFNHRRQALDDRLVEDLVQRGVVGVEGAPGKTGSPDDVVDAGALHPLGHDHLGRGLPQASPGVLPLAQTAPAAGLASGAARGRRHGGLQVSRVDDQDGQGGTASARTDATGQRW